MKKLFMGVLVVVAGLCIAVKAGETNTLENRLTLELRDGSRVVGVAMKGKIKFTSPLLGEIKLAVSDIRSVEMASTNSAKLTTIKDDTLAVAFVDRVFALQTSFGKIEVQTDSLKKFP